MTADLQVAERPAETALLCLEAVLQGSQSLTPTARLLLEHARVQVQESKVREALARMFTVRTPYEVTP